MRSRLTIVLVAASLVLSSCGDDGDDGGDGSASTTTVADATRPGDRGDRGDRGEREDREHQRGEDDGDDSGDGEDGEDGATSTVELTTADGRTRSYRLHVPATVGDEPVPLVVALHGGGGSADQFARQNGLESLADEEGFVVVHPEGIAGRLGRAHTWNAGNCCGPAAAEAVDDVAFVRAVVDEVAATHPIDTDRVFALGHSNGGMLAYRLACEAADLFAAVGLQAGALGIETCDPAAPVSLLHVHGTADTNVPLEGGVGSGVAGVAFRPTLESLAIVSTAQGCDDPAGSTTTWSCPDGAEVRLTLVEGEAHGWMDDSSDLIWDFLQHHPRR